MFMPLQMVGRTNPKTLSGIETLIIRRQRILWPLAGKTLKPYQGLKPINAFKSAANLSLAGKTLKPYQGLKPTAEDFYQYLASRKNPKTLSGIETIFAICCGGCQCAGKTLKPYQGLKLQSANRANFLAEAGKTLKPYQGLKLCLFFSLLACTKPEKP